MLIYIGWSFISLLSYLKDKKTYLFLYSYLQISLLSFTKAAHDFLVSATTQFLFSKS